MLLAVAAGLAQASEYDVDRVHFNYQMSCQGCHTPDGVGARNVPRLKDHVGIFTTTTAGREYLVRVPGSATSALNDEDLAAVLNWIVVEFSGSSVNHAFEPYTADEVGRLRQHPLNEVAQYRVELLSGIGRAGTGESNRP
jgi:mono/diheme cytochrome c family protein